MAGGPEGGPKDVTPPVLRRVYPEPYTVNFSEKEITLFFDEYVELNDVSKEVVITPTLDVPPNITSYRKGINLDFSGSTLRPNTTYSIQFGKAIKDLNEGNIAPPYRYVFSTGPYLDSLRLQASAVTLPEKGKPENLKLMLYPVDDDSAVLKRKPLYFAADTGGAAIRLTYLTPGKYSVFALADKNDNYLADRGEYVGVYPATIVLTKDTVLKDPIQMYPFTAADFSLADVRATRNQLRLKFTLAVDSVQSPVQSTFPSWYSAERDSVILYSRNDSFTDPIRILARRGQTVLDTNITLGAREKGDVSLKLTPESGAKALTKAEALLLVNVSEPISGVDTGRIRVFVADKRWNGKQYGLVTPTPFSFAFTGLSKLAEGTAARFVVFPGAVKGMSGRTNKDTLSVQVNFPRHEDLGYLEMRLTPPIAGQSFVFQLVDPNKQVMWSKIISRETLIVLPFAEPGDYTLRAIHDKNRNGVWDPGNPLTRELPEPVYFHKDPVTVKANWEIRDLEFNP